MMQRPLCVVCNSNPAAINYIKEGQHHYRKLCDSCIRKGKKLKPIPQIGLSQGIEKNLCAKNVGIEVSTQKNK